MKIYLASSYSRRLELLGYAKLLANDGHEITSEWITGVHEEPGWHEARYAAVDMSQVLVADAIVVFTGVGTRGGHHVEFGIALGSGRAAMIVGPRINCFHYLPSVAQFDTFEQAREALRGAPMRGGGSMG